MSTKTRDYRFVVRGMTCEHCVTAVEKAAAGVPGVEQVEVDLGSGTALVRTREDLDPQRVADAIGRAGYEAEPEQDHSSGRGDVRFREPPSIRTGARSETEVDLLVVGGGSAGFAAAIRAHELGARVVLVNSGVIGGTCVNVGCIPSKTLIRAAEAHHRARNHPFAGMEHFSRLTDFGAVIRQKDELVASLRKAKYADVLAGYSNIRLVEGRAQFVSPNVIRAGELELKAPRIVVATGSRPWIPPIPGLREAGPLTSTTTFELDHLPRSVIVLGGRYVALECAQMLARFGAEVTILQRSDHILPTEDDDLTEALTRYLQEEGIGIETSVRVKRVERSEGRLSVYATVKGQDRLFTAEQILCATGRRPNTEEMGLEELGARLDEGGHIVVDDFLQSSVPGIFAAGDVIGEPAFVYTAAYEGNLAAYNALGTELSLRDYSALPWVIFTDPQVAAVGLNEKEARRRGLSVDVARLELEHVPRALAARDTRGFIKLIKEHGTDRLVGARILAPEGGEQIMEAAMAIRHGIGVSEIASMFHPYLTQAEGIKLCAQAFLKDISRLPCCSA